MEKLKFLPVNFALHSDICVQFRADTFFCSFNTDKPFWEEGGPGGERYLAWLKAKNPKRYGVFHVWKDEKIIGQLELGERKVEDDFGYVNLYYLVREERGQGYSTALDAFSTEFLKSLGYRKAKLSVSPTNSRAINFYKKNGWIDLGLRTEPSRTESLQYPVHYMGKSF